MVHLCANSSEKHLFSKGDSCITQIAPWRDDMKYNIGIVGNIHFEEFVLQAVQPDYPLTPIGQWLHEPVDDSVVESCFKERDTLRNSHGNMHSLFARWIPLRDYGPVKFRATISVNSTHVWTEVTSEELNHSNENIDSLQRHRIVKRDAEETVTDEATTLENTTIEEKAKTAGPNTGHSVFILMAILGGYVGMYTVFSFLII